MKFPMTVTVTRIENVEIPDLPESVMNYVASHNGVVEIYCGVGCGSSGDEYAYIYVNIYPAADSINEGIFYSQLYNIPEYDARMMSGRVPYFVSDTADGLDGCEQWYEAMKAYYTSVPFMK